MRLKGEGPQVWPPDALWSKEGPQGSLPWWRQDSQCILFPVQGQMTKPCRQQQELEGLC